MYDGEEQSCKSCTVRLFTDVFCNVVLSGELDHIHEMNHQKMERLILRAAFKRKAIDMASELRSKIINAGE